MLHWKWQEEWNSLVLKVTALTGKADLSQSTEREEQKTQALTLRHSEAGGSYGEQRDKYVCAAESNVEMAGASWGDN